MQLEVHTAAENCSQQISKTFEQIVNFCASVADHQTNKKSRILIHIFYVFIQNSSHKIQTN
jgi:hypothetical protein